MQYGEVFILNRVENGNYGRIDIFHNHIETHTGATIFLTIREKNPADALRRMREFCKNSKGDFTVFLRRYDGQHWNSAEVIKIHLSHSLATSPVNGNIDVESLVNARMNAFISEMNHKNELERLREENARLTQPMERIMFVLEGVVSKFIGGQPVAGTPINGTGNIDEQALNEAFAGLVQKFGAAGVIKLNAYLNENPETVGMVKNFAKL